MELAVDVRTDLRPQLDFHTVRTSLAVDAGSDRETTHGPTPSEDFLGGTRVAEFRDLAPGEMTVRVELLGPGGGLVASRRVRFTMQDSRVITVVITSDCADVSCPGGDDPAGATECFGGQCVPPECRHAGDPACEGAGAECEADADCPTAVSCAEAFCADGVCFNTPDDALCPGGEYCDVRSGCREAPAFDAGVRDSGMDRPDSGMDASSAVDGGPDAAMGDAGPSDAGGADGGGCRVSCDDGIDCTIDSCGDGGCEHVPDDAACTDGPEGTCDPELGCQYASCTAESCTPDADCQTATCEGDVCVRTNLCGTGEMCCAGSCVPAGCDDGLDCTMDACGADGCEHVPTDGACDDGNPCTDDQCTVGTGCEHLDNTASCNDGTFCNGADTCSGGSCADHAGDPCGSSTVCDETAGECVGCIDDADCPDDQIGTWSSCSFSGTCAESGTQSRTVTTYSCTGGSCVSDTTTETRSCSRDTDGTTCGSTNCGDWSCSYSGTCSESGTETRTCTDRVCSAGTCTDDPRVESRPCTRDTDGTTCGSTSCGDWSCSYSGTCSESGTETRTCTDQVCSAGSCTDDPRMESRPCSRDTDGTTCGATTCGSCSYSGTCDETGTRPCTERVCSSGSCVDNETSQGCSRDTDGTSCGADSCGSCSYDTTCDETGTKSCTEPTCQTGSCIDLSTTQGCSRDTDGNFCNDFSKCTWGEQCSGGVCTPDTITECPAGCTCDPGSGVCEPDGGGEICPY